MKKTFLEVTATLVCCASAWAAESERPTVATMPPVIVKTEPQAGDMKVDPATTEIKVTFSKRMSTGKNYSWVGGDAFPQTTGQPRWLADDRSCVLPVKLEPGRTYVIWLNSQKAANFRDAKGQSAIPYLLVFETAKK